MKRIFIISTVAVIAWNALICYGKDFATVINSREYSPELEKYAQEGNAMAQNTLGVVYNKGLGVEKDINKAVYWWQKAVDRGHDNAMVNLGEAYLNGTGVDKDPVRAAELFEQAALQDNQAGMFNLATMYLKGEGVPRDPAKAFSYAEKAANAKIKTEIVADTNKGISQHSNMQVTAKAQGFLAFCYRMGIGTQKDMAKSMEYLEKAANNGDLNSCMILADAYENGKNVTKDFSVAERYYRKAADEGMSLAQYALGIKFATGKTLRKDTQEAIKYFTKAVEVNKGTHPMIKADALLQLADLLEATGTQENAEKAEKYRNQAAALPAPDPAKIMEMLSTD